MEAAYLMRRALEGLVGDVRFGRRLPRDLGGGRFVVNARAGGLKYWKPNIESLDPSLFRFARRFVRPGNLVWDVGTNVGLFTFAAAHLAGADGRVIAVEPDLDVCRLLMRSLKSRQSSDARIDLVQAAVTAASSACVELQVSRRARASNAVVGAGASQMGGVLETRLVPAISLDGLLSSVGAPDVIKIDVEGHEVSVLRGAMEVLSASRPRMYIEVQSETWAAVSDILLAAGYKLFDGDDPDYPACTGPVFNVLALHPATEATFP